MRREGERANDSESERRQDWSHNYIFAPFHPRFLLLWAILVFDRRISSSVGLVHSHLLNLMFQLNVCQQRKQLGISRGVDR